jgi:hypothetical protein
MFCRADWQSVTVVSGQLIGLPSLEDGTDRLTRNVGKYQVINMYWGGVGLDPCILHINTRYRWVVSFKPRLIYPWTSNTYWGRSWMYSEQVWKLLHETNACPCQDANPVPLTTDLHLLQVPLDRLPVWDLEARVQDEANVYVEGPAGGEGAGASKDQQPLWRPAAERFPPTKFHSSRWHCLCLPFALPPPNISCWLSCYLVTSHFYVHMWDVFTLLSCFFVLYIT